MKKWLGFMMIIGVLVYAVVENEAVCRWALAKVEIDEGPFPNEAFDKAKFFDQNAFVEKYRPMLERRAQIVKVAAVFGNTDLCLAISSKAVDMYKECPLDTDENFQYLLFRKAVSLDDKGQINDAKAAYIEFMEKFPESKFIDEARQRREKLDIAAASR